MRYTVAADTINDAIAKYAKIVNDTTGATISANSIKNKEPMYIDVDGQSCQIGFVFTASTKIYDYDKLPKGSKQYIDLWATITVSAFD